METGEEGAAAQVVAGAHYRRARRGVEPHRAKNLLIMFKEAAPNRCCALVTGLIPQTIPLIFTPFQSADKRKPETFMESPMISSRWGEPKVASASDQIQTRGKGNDATLL